MFRALEPGDADLTVTVDGRPFPARRGETVAAFLLRHGLVPTRRTPGGRPRAPYCLMGACFECVVEMDGRANVQSCLALVRDGLSIRRMLRP